MGAPTQATVVVVQTHGWTGLKYTLFPARQGVHPDVAMSAQRKGQFLPVLTKASCRPAAALLPPLSSVISLQVESGFPLLLPLGASGPGKHTWEPSKLLGQVSTFWVLTITQKCPHKALTLESIAASLYMLLFSVHNLYRLILVNLDKILVSMSV